MNLLPIPEFIVAAQGRPSWLLLLVCLCLPLTAAALEDDANQAVIVEADSQDYTLGGMLVLYGTEETPVRITQGTLEITGLEVHINQEGETIKTMVAHGQPARFQQQLAEGEDPIRAAGLTLSFDNEAQTIAIVEEAELVLPNGTRSTGYQFDYDLRSKHLHSSSSPDGERIRIVIPPAAGQ